MIGLTASQERRQIAAADAADILAVSAGRYARRAVTALEVVQLAAWILNESHPETTSRALEFMPRVGSFE